MLSLSIRFAIVALATVVRFAATAPLQDDTNSAAGAEAAYFVQGQKQISGNDGPIDVALYADMLVIGDNGNLTYNLLRVGTAHAFSWFTTGYSECMTFSPSDSPNADNHDFYLWSESVNLHGELWSGSLKFDGQDMPLTNVLFLNSIHSDGSMQYSSSNFTGNGNGVLGILPSIWPATDGTVVSNLDWRSLAQEQKIHLFARRNSNGPGNQGVLRFGGSRPEDSQLNVTTTSDECFAVVPMPPLNPQNVATYGYSIQVDLITYSDGGDGASIYDEIYYPIGYQIDTTCPFIQTANRHGLEEILKHYSPQGWLTENDEVAEVSCDAAFAGYTEIVLDVYRFKINPVDMVVKDPFSDGRCFSAYQPPWRTRGLPRLGWPFLYNVGVTFDFGLQLHNITSRPYYPNEKI